MIDYKPVQYHYILTLHIHVSEPIARLSIKSSLTNTKRQVQDVFAPFSICAAYVQFMMTVMNAISERIG